MAALMNDLLLFNRSLALKFHIEFKRPAKETGGQGTTHSLDQSYMLSETNRRMLLDAIIDPTREFLLNNSVPVFLHIPNFPSTGFIDVIGQLQQASYAPLGGQNVKAGSGFSNLKLQQYYGTAGSLKSWTAQFELNQNVSAFLEKDIDYGKDRDGKTYLQVIGWFF
jgi:hypothetical protein